MTSHCLLPCWQAEIPIVEHRSSLLFVVVVVVFAINVERTGHHQKEKCLFMQGSESICPLQDKVQAKKKRKQKKTKRKDVKRNKEFKQLEITQNAFSWLVSQGTTHPREHSIVRRHQAKTKRNSNNEEEEERSTATKFK